MADSELVNSLPSNAAEREKSREHCGGGCEKLTIFKKLWIREAIQVDDLCGLESAKINKKVDLVAKGRMRLVQDDCTGEKSEWSRAMLSCSSGGRD